MTASACGLLNIHKPAGLTSRRVVDHVVRLIRPAKAGHAGTLDPLATGVLVVCVGSATRLIPHVQHGRKQYRAKFILGQRSNTDDMTGEIETVPNVQPISREQLESLLPDFLGRVEQTPPQFSAVHVKGKRAYELARHGQQVELTSRLVEIDVLEITHFDYPEFTLNITCGSGTYVRSIGRDLGEKLGCGAIMTELTRTAVGPFSLDNAIDLDDLTSDSLAESLQPPALAVGHLPRYQCSTEQLEHISHGRKLTIVQNVSFHPAECVAIFTPDGKLAALAEWNSAERILSPRQVFVQNLN
ncbi:MAG: tRNA pseudouridine(55) synthase TruB [Planctomycetaceae bacterium]